MAQQVSGRQPRYKRILLKLSGEALMGSEDFGIDPKVLDRMALEVGQLVGIGVQVGLVIGGGNLFRGAALSAAGMDRVTGEIATRPSPPDRERQSSYCLLVTVEDEGTPSLSVSRWGAGLSAAWGWVQEGVDKKLCGDALTVWPYVTVLL